MSRKLTDAEYQELLDKKQSLEKRSYKLRTRLGIATKLVHGQKLPREIWTSPYYKELIEKKAELAEINKKLNGQGRGSPRSFPARFMDMVKEKYPQIFDEISAELQD